MQKIDFDGLAPLLPAVYIYLTSCRGITLPAGTQEHSLSVGQSFIVNVMIFFTGTPQFHAIQQT